MADMQAQMQ
jgi:hypothetical protein